MDFTGYVAVAYFQWVGKLLGRWTQVADAQLTESKNVSGFTLYYNPREGL